MLFFHWISFYTYLIHRDQVRVHPGVINPLRNPNEKFLETKSNILGMSQTIIMIFLSILALVPSVFVKSFAKTDPDKLNQPFGRFCVFLSKTTIPVVFFLILPLLMYAFNKKVRMKILRELKEIFRYMFNNFYVIKLNIWDWLLKVV